MAPRIIAQWPSTFTPWVADDEVAARLWLSRSENFEFRRWISALANKTYPWVDLVLCIKTVLNIDESIIIECSSQVCERIWGNRGLGQHSSLEEQKKIGLQTAALVLRRSSAPWVEEATTWTHHAFVTLTPRLISIWKKSQSKRDVSPEVRRGSRRQLINITPTPPTGSHVSKSRHTHYSRGRPKSKKQKTDNRSKQVVPSDGHQEESQCLNPQMPDRFAPASFIGRNIVVYLDKNLDPDESIPLCSIIGVENCLDPKSNFTTIPEIRYTDLDWQTFLGYLNLIYPMYNFPETRLVYDILQEDNQIESIDVQDAEGFHCAVGVLDWYATKKGANRDLAMRLMAPEPRYRY